jgi:hypothetical protein
MKWPENDTRLSMLSQQILVHPSKFLAAAMPRRVLRQLLKQFSASFLNLVDKSVSPQFEPVRFPFHIFQILHQPGDQIEGDSYNHQTIRQHLSGFHAEAKTADGEVQFPA